MYVHGNKEALEFNGENSYYSEAVCLNKQGKIQANAMGELIKEIDLPIGTIISSPVCRARQTAEIMFGSYDDLDPVLINFGFFEEPSCKCLTFKDILPQSLALLCLEFSQIL